MSFKRGPTYSNGSYATTSETDLITFGPNNHYKAGFVVFITSTAVGGTLKLYYIDPKSSEWVIDSVAVTANQLSILSVDYPVPKAKVTFTASAATSSDVNSEIFGK